MALEPDCRDRGLELHYQAWLAFREFFLIFLLSCLSAVIAAFNTSHQPVLSF